jgi:hypothetical protein
MTQRGTRPALGGRQIRASRVAWRVLAPAGMRSGVLIALVGPWLVLPACGGVALEDASAAKPATTSSDCGASSCKKCPDGYRNEGTCTNGTWNCRCAPEPVSTCGAVPICDQGDIAISATMPCSPTSKCYSRSECGTTIHCMTPPSPPTPTTCDAYPTCNLGDEEVAPPDCAASPGCYQATMCGTTILCRPIQIWSSTESTRLVAIDDGGGFVPTPPPGSACKMGQAQYTFSAVAGQLEWKVCKTTVSPYVFVSGIKTLTSAAAQSVKATAAQLKISSATTCGDDKSMRKVQITSSAGVTREYLDSFYACQGAGLYVDNIDALFAQLELFRD